MGMRTRESVKQKWEEKFEKKLVRFVHKIKTGYTLKQMIFFHFDNSANVVMNKLSKHCVAIVEWKSISYSMDFTSTLFFSFFFRSSSSFFSYFHPISVLYVIFLPFPFFLALLFLDIFSFFFFGSLYSVGCSLAS